VIAGVRQVFGAPISVGPGEWINVLREAGAAETPHRDRVSLLAHLTGTERILAAWAQPEAVRAAGGLHSIYGSEVFKRRIVNVSRRGEIAARVGAEAERLAFLFSRVRRTELFEAARDGLPSSPIALGGAIVAPEEAAALLVIHMANTLEQVPVDAPFPWLSQFLAWGGMLRPDDKPPFLAECPRLSPEDEFALRRCYARAHADFVGGAIAEAAGGFERSAGMCSGLPEPWLWSAAARLRLGDFPAAAERAARSARLAASWGGVWDKSLSPAKRDALAAALKRLAMERRGADLPAPAAYGIVRYAERVEAAAFRAPQSCGAAKAETSPLPPRLAVYFAAVFGSSTPRAPRYPGLSVMPWHDPQDFEIVAALETSYPMIHAEVSALTRFQTESESIQRVGRWDVAFLYESGRRNDDVCHRCPTLTRIVESFPTMRTFGGLIYVSRLAPGTVIKPHSANSPLRLRCHLAIDAPGSGAGIAVDGQARSWRNGKCLVFDDCFDHHAWNRSDRERVVVVIDLWHPELDAEEIRLLKGFHRYVERQGDWLIRYRSANGRARVQADEVRDG
jgi:hypothetical protein